MRNAFFFGRGSALPRLAHSNAGDDGGGGGQGNSGGTWADSLPEDVRSWDEVKNSEDPAKFWDQMTNMRSRMGSSIRIPSEEAGDEDRAKFHEKLKAKVPGLMATPDFEKDETLQDLYAKMGRPVDSKGYVTPEFKDSKGQPIQNLDTTMAEALKEVAHKAGLNQAKYAEIVSSITNASISKYEAMLDAQRADHDALATEWGAAHDRNSKIVENFISKSDAPEAVLKAMKTGMMDRSTMVWLHRVASQTLGTGSGFQGDDSNKGVMTPDEAALKISEIRNNPNHAYNKGKSDPGNEAAKKLMRSLYLLKDPKGGTKSAPGTSFQIGGVSE